MRHAADSRSGPREAESASSGFVAGVDGGGTGSRALILDLRGKEVGSGEGPPALVHASDPAGVAGAIVNALLKQGYVHAKTERARLQEHIARLILQTMEEEKKLEQEAERLAATHARRMAGMDQRKIIQGIKERLARERGFPL